MSACPFCGGFALELQYRGLRNPLAPDLGPFDFHRCRSCGSGVTAKPPSEETLRALYSRFSDGLPQRQRDAYAADPQTAWYRACLDRISSLGRLGDRAPNTGEMPFTWLELGAGGGELSAMMAARFPAARGTAVDQHAVPGALSSSQRVRWQTADLNRPGFADDLGVRADVVFAIAVWEHVSDPFAFAREAVRLVSPGGLLYLVCPDYGSTARRLMRRRWPYFSPGEHLNVPTLAGARRCLLRAAEASDTATRDAPAPIVRARAVWLPYTIGYVARRFGLDRLAAHVSPGLAVPLPAGALEASLVRPG
jgi:SAM-dependent methyltransferase